ncbi:MAG: hypothetical protein LBO77_03290 [Desulfovibrio sp.]|jgi:hypothetical protein|nr:hypothetical protein [Desulfovibrio sp.]
MAGNNAITLPVVQMGHVEKLVEFAQNQPHVQQLASQQTIVQDLKKQDDQVPRADKAAYRRVRAKEEEESGGDPRRPLSQDKEQREAPEEDKAPPAVPWSGHLLDVKV